MSNNIPSEELNRRFNYIFNNIYPPASNKDTLSFSGGEESDLLYNIFFYLIIILFIIYLYQSRIGEHIKKSAFNILNVINKSVPDEFKIENFQSLLFDTPEKEIVLKNSNEKEYLIFKTGYGLQGTYPEECSKLIRAKIYPTESISTGGSIDNIIQLLNNKLDIAFIDEQILYEFVNNLNPELNSYIARQMNFSDNKSKNNQDIIESEEQNNNISNSISFDNMGNYLNFSLIAPLYYQPFFFIAKQSTSANPVTSINDLKNVKTGIKTVGVIGPNGNSYYHLQKIFKINGLISGENINLVLFDTQQQMIEAFSENKIVDGKKLDVIYFTSNHKNEELLKLSKDLKLRFIDPFPPTMTFLQFSEGQYLKEMPFFTFRDKGITKISDLKGKRIFTSSNDKNKLKKLIENYEIINQNQNNSQIYNSLTIISNKPNGQPYNSGEELIELIINNQVEVLYLPTMFQRNTLLNSISNMVANDIFQFGDRLSQNDLRQSVGNDIQKNNLRQIVENEMKYAFPRNINLNHFYQNINDRNSIPSYATRMCLVARNQLPIKQVYYLVDNIVKKLYLLRQNMNQYQFNRNIDNTVSDAFQLSEFVSSSKTIPIHPSAKQKYIQLGLIKVKESVSTDL